MLIARGKKFRKYYSKKRDHKRIRYDGQILRERSTTDETAPDAVMAAAKALSLAVRPGLRRFDPRNLVNISGCHSDISAD